MRIELSELSLVLEREDKQFAKTFWKQLVGYHVRHIIRGHGIITDVEETIVSVRHFGRERRYSVRALHQYLTDITEIPEDSIAAPAIKFERELQSLGEQWAGWQIDWRGLWLQAEDIKELLQSCRSPDALTDADIYRARSIGVGHIIPIAYEFAGQDDPWNYVRAASHWRKLQVPARAVDCVTQRLGPALRANGAQRDLVRAGLTTLVAALLDSGQIDLGLKYAQRLSKLEPNDQSCLALFRYFRQSGDEDQMNVWLAQARAFGIEPAEERRTDPRRWLSNWQPDQVSVSTTSKR